MSGGLGVTPSFGSPVAPVKVWPKRFTSDALFRQAFNRKHLVDRDWAYAGAPLEDERRSDPEIECQLRGPPSEFARFTNRGFSIHKHILSAARSFTQAQIMRCASTASNVPRL